MRSFIVNLGQLFKLDSGLPGAQNFLEDKRRLLIPLYQREYKWEDDRIETLLNDIKIKDKFLGNIILDETNNCYEVVDGQQRLTTCVLILAALFSKYAGMPLEQSAILELLKPYGTFILQNDSVKDYLKIENDIINISIDDAMDVYGQKVAFLHAYKIIQSFLEEFTDNNSLSEFKNKLYSCKFLILINDDHNFTQSVEQLFLDINEKAQLLLVEDIFKGHCFEKYSATQRPYLKEKWVKIKTLSFGFKAFGVEDTSQYIYLYLLENYNNNLPASLSESGKHYLANKSMDEIDILLQDMINFGQSNLALYTDLKKDDYRFIDLCLDAEPHKNTPDHKALKQMCLSILNNTKSNYQKLPFLYFIHHIKKINEGNRLLQYFDFRRTITNLYIYSILFSHSNNKKSKKSIDHSLRDAIKRATPTTSVEVVRAARTLRKSHIDDLIIKPTFSLETMQFIYSIIDNYVAADEWLKTIYDYQVNNVNKEHLVIPDNKRSVVQWVIEDKNTVAIPISTDIAKLYKKSTLNYILLNETLNGRMQSFDIVYKITTIKEWYKVNSPMPAHISFIIADIESLPEYQKLIELKDQSPSQDELIVAYNIFVSKYFERENEVIEKIHNKFIGSFTSN